MKSPISRPVLHLACLVILLSFVFGCASKTTANGSSKDWDGPLKKKLILAPFASPVQLPGVDMAGSLMAPMRKTLQQECPEVILLSSPTIEAQVTDYYGPAAGIARGRELLERARLAGANAVACGTLADVSVEMEKRGIYGFRDTLPVAHIVLHSWVYDTLTGVKILDKTIESEVLGNEGMGNQVAIPAQLIEEMAMEAAEAMCEALEDALWRGFISRVEGAAAVISAGSNVGLGEGDILLVHKPGQRVEGFGGNTYILPGKKVGEIKITKVEASSAEGLETNGQALEAGDWVTLSD